MDEMQTGNQISAEGLQAFMAEFGQAKLGLAEANARIVKLAAELAKLRDALAATMPPAGDTPADAMAAEFELVPIDKKAKGG